jgi:hypothetical protein
MTPDQKAAFRHKTIETLKDRYPLSASKFDTIFKNDIN